MSMVVLVLNCDRSTGTGFIRALRRAQGGGWGADVTILGTAAHPLRTVLSDADRTFLIDSDRPDRVVAEISRRTGRDIDLVYETRSAEAMLRLSRARHRVPTFLAPHEILAVFEDKYRTFLHLSAHGLPVPRTFLISRPGDVHRAFARLSGRSAWIRRTHGQGGRGAFASDSPAEVVATLERHRGWNRYTLSERLPTDRAHPWADRLSSRLLPGEMITWGALYAHGKLIAGQTRKRLYWEHADLTRSGVTGYTGAAMTLTRPDVHALSEKIVRSFDWAPHGPLGIDYLVDEAGELKVTEIQASRFFTSTYPLALSGLNLPRLFVDAARGVTDTVDSVDPCPEGLLYVQRFGSPGRIVHRDDVLAAIEAGQFSMRSEDDSHV